MGVTSKPGLLPGAVLMMTALVAAGSSVLVLLMLWKYVPAQAAHFACGSEPLPPLTNAVFYVANWTIRLLPFLIILFGPIIGAIAVGVIVIAITAGRNGVWTKRATRALAVLIGLEAFAAGLIVYATRVPPERLERVCDRRSAAELTPGTV